MQQSKNIKIASNPSQHTKKKNREYQQGGVKDENGWRKFQLSDSQKKCLEIIDSNTITFVEGKAGSGKSLCSLYAAVKNYINEPSQRVFVIRTPMEATLHDKVGFLPSDLSDKLQPHFASTKALLEDLLTPQKVDADINGPYKRIQFLVPNFILGATIDDATIIVDEGQTMNPVIMKLLLERIGVRSKMIVLGDPSQVYSSNKDRQGMRDAISKFFELDKDGNVLKSKYNDIGYYEFSIDDCMRSDIVKTVLKAYN